jgi:hypothetical protein
MDYATPSRDNPGLVIFVIDVSGSMKNSNVLDDIRKAMPYVKAIGRKKPRMIKFFSVTFSKTYRTDESWIEDAQIHGLESVDDRTHLKQACKVTRGIYDRHVTDCEADNPLTNILFFTDGGHSPGLDVTRYASFSGTNPNEWGDKNPSQWLGLENEENVLTGVIDYDFKHPMESLPIPSKYPSFRSSRFTAASVLDENLIRQAYKQEEEDGTIPLGDSLKGNFGPPENLIGRKLIIGAELIKKTPRLTLAFIKIGTFSFRQGDDGDNAFKAPTAPDPGPLDF